MPPPRCQRLYKFGETSLGALPIEVVKMSTEDRTNMPIVFQVFFQAAHVQMVGDEYPNEIKEGIIDLVKRTDLRVRPSHMAHFQMLKRAAKNGDGKVSVARIVTARFWTFGSVVLYSGLLLFTVRYHCERAEQTGQQKSTGPVRMDEQSSLRVENGKKNSRDW